MQFDDKSGIFCTFLNKFVLNDYMLFNFASIFSFFVTTFPIDFPNLYEYVSNIDERAFTVNADCSSLFLSRLHFILFQMIAKIRVFWCFRQLFFIKWWESIGFRNFHVLTNKYMELDTDTEC